VGSLGHDFCFPPHLVLFLDFFHLETNATDYRPNMFLAEQSGSHIHRFADVAQASREAAPVARGELAGRFQNRPRATALTLGCLLAVAADGFLRNPLRGDGEGAAPVARGELAGRFQNRPRATRARAPER
jgi:hypothetical protein